MKRRIELLLIGLLVISANAALAGVFGQYEISDFSSYNRAITLGAAVSESSITQHNGMDFVTLSGDNGFIKTDSGLQGFTYNSDWSWMTIIKKDPAINSAVFMRGWGWQDKAGDFSIYAMTGTDMSLLQFSEGFPTFDIQSPVLNTSDTLWLAGTYDLSQEKYTIYANGIEIGSKKMYSFFLDDRNNPNPMNINGQWAGGKYGIGNVYREGTIELSQFILAQTCYSETDLRQVYDSGTYMPSDNNTWLDIKVVPEPATVLLFGLGGFLLRKKRKTV